MNSKKLISVALTATTVVWALGIAALPLANAQTASGLQAQITALLAQIQQLQAQLGSTQGTGSSYSFTSDLTVGSRGADVTALQQLLINKGYLTAVSAPTGYFGSLTQAALGKFQAANGISPAAGYFGPITRAFVNSMTVGTTTTTTSYPAGCTSSSGYSPTTGQSCASGTTTTTVTPPATGLAVSLSSSNPAAGSLVSSQSAAAARVPVLAINLTASNSGAVTVTDVKVHKTGVLSDSSIAGAYLVQNGQVLYQYTSLNKGVIDFSGLALSVSAGQTQTLWVAIDPSTNLASGNTVGFAVSAASDITAVDASNNAITPSGAFPLTGSIFTVTTVSNPSLASLTTASSSIATQVTAGTQNNIVGAWTFTGQNSLTYLKGIKFTVIGSANNADIRNVKLNVNGAQVGSALATVGANGVAYFDLSSSPASINTGSNNVQVFADVMGSPSKNFAFEILNSYDVYAVDSQYNVPISVSVVGGAGTQVGIQQGQITVSQDSATPTGNIAVGQSGVVLAKFDIYAAGEPVKVKFLGFQIALTSVTTSSGVLALSNMLKNISLVDDAGGQVGTTINTPPSGNTCDTGTNTIINSATDGTFKATSGNYVDCFGTNNSPINYIIPANTTRVLSLKADIQSTASFLTIAASLLAETASNLQGLTSSQPGSSSGASGSALSLQSSLLSIAANSAYGNQTVTPNSTGVHIGSYSFTASSASGVQINTISLKPAPSSTGSGDIQNMKVMIGGTQFGTTQGVVADAGTYTFSGSPFTIAAGQTTNVDVYADILSGASSQSPASSLTGCSGTSVVSYSALSCSGITRGQSLTVATSGTSITVSTNQGYNPSVSQLSMGTNNNTLAAFNFQETKNIEPVRVTDLYVADALTTSTLGVATNTANVLPSFGTLTLWNGSTQVGNAATYVGATVVSGQNAFLYHFSFGGTPSPFVIPQNGTLALTLKGGVNSYSAGNVTDGAIHTFEVATSTAQATAIATVVALGNTSNISTGVTLSSAAGTQQTVLQNVLSFSGAVNGSVSSRPKSTSDQLATVTFTPINSGSVAVNTTTITLSGSAISATSAVATAFATSTYLYLNGTKYTPATTSCASQSCTITWSFGVGINGFQVNGSPVTFQLYADDQDNTVVAGSNNSVSLAGTVSAATSIQYTDGTNSNSTTVTGVTLTPAITTPLQVFNVQFQQNS
ncbi:MAG: peptidoglycan-binding domain-containing protein [Minisyncoccia bacterium]|jgi:hypothetical protein